MASFIATPPAEKGIILAGGVDEIVMNIITRYATKLKLILNQAVEIKRSVAQLTIQEAIYAIVQGDMMIHFLIE